MIGEMHLELGIRGWGSAVRRCDPIHSPIGTQVWVTEDYSAFIGSYGIRLGTTATKDVLEIYVDSDQSPNGFPDEADDETELKYLRRLRTLGWKFKKETK